MKAKTIDAYLASVTGDRRKLLDELRATIHKIIPDAEECISYSIPAFRLDGRIVAGFMARANGCSYLPFSGTTLATLAPLVKKYKHTKSSLHFTTPLPAALVRKLIAARRAE